MSKEFVKGVAVKAAEENAQQEVREYETNADETRSAIRENEEDFIQGLINATEYGSEETQRIEIIRDGRLYFAFRIRPLSSEEYDACRKKHTKYVRNKRLGIKTPEETDRVKYQSALIYKATVDEDREKLWDNRKVWKAINDKKDRIINGLDVVECAMKAGEKDKVIEAIDKLSGYDDDLEETAKN